MMPDWFFVVLIWTGVGFGVWRDRRKSRRKASTPAPVAPLLPLIPFTPTSTSLKSTVWRRREETGDIGVEVTTALTVPECETMRVSRDLVEKILVEAGYWPEQKDEAAKDTA